MNKKNENKSAVVKFDLGLWDDSWTYIKTVVDIVREPVLVLNKDFKIIAANECFYSTFKVTVKDTEGKVVYELGNGQWKKLLEDILPKHTFFKGFEVTHEFPKIGRKIMILNARQMFVKEDKAGKDSIILLAMEDVTEMMIVAEMLSEHAKKIKEKLKTQVGKFEEEIKKK
jgi:chemotaxis protein methyltransferase CheR